MELKEYEMASAIEYISKMKEAVKKAQQVVSKGKKGYRYIETSIEINEATTDINVVTVDINNFLGDDKGKSLIYIIREISLKDYKESFGNFEKEKQKKYGHEYPRCNGINESGIWYVGQSKNIVSRLRQHLVTAPKGTYALKASHWFTGQLEIEIRDYGDNFDKDVLQIIEDALHMEMQPMFGKRGAR